MIHFISKVFIVRLNAKKYDQLKRAKCGVVPAQDSFLLDSVLMTLNASAVYFVRGMNKNTFIFC